MRQSNLNFYGCGDVRLELTVSSAFQYLNIIRPDDPVQSGIHARFIRRSLMEEYNNDSVAF